jgi:hypothetical protein
MTAGQLIEILEYCPENTEIVIDKGYSKCGVSQIRLIQEWALDTEMSRLEFVEER